MKVTYKLVSRHSDPVVAIRPAPPFCHITVVTFANSEGIVEISDLHSTTDLQIWHKGSHFSVRGKIMRSRGFKDVERNHSDTGSSHT